jgi:hypothetical protein
MQFQLTSGKQMRQAECPPAKAAYHLTSDGRFLPLQPEPARGFAILYPSSLPQGLDGLTVPDCKDNNLDPMVALKVHNFCAESLAVAAQHPPRAETLLLASRVTPSKLFYHQAVSFF